MSSSHVESDAHEELDALVSDLVESGHFPTETSSIVATSGRSGYDVNTAMPVATGEGGGRREEEGVRGERER